MQKTPSLFTALMVWSLGQLVILVQFIADRLPLVPTVCFPLDLGVDKHFKLIQDV